MKVQVFLIPKALLLMIKIICLSICFKNQSFTYLQAAVMSLTCIQTTLFKVQSVQFVYLSFPGRKLLLPCPQNLAECRAERDTLYLISVKQTLYLPYFPPLPNCFTQWQDHKSVGISSFTYCYFPKHLCPHSSYFHYKAPLLPF